jgi:hypothetical protein
LDQQEANTYRGQYLNLHIKNTQASTLKKIANEVAEIIQKLGIDNAESDDVIKLLDTHSQPLTNEEPEDLTEQSAQKQQWQEHEDSL